MTPSPELRELKTLTDYLAEKHFGKDGGSFYKQVSRYEKSLNDVVFAITDDNESLFGKIADNFLPFINDTLDMVKRANEEMARAYSTEGYVASRNSAVFHRGCTLAATISEQNLVRYDTRDEAIAAGKRPCEECNP